MKLAKALLPCLILVAASAIPAKADHGGLGLSYMFGYQGYHPIGMQAYVPPPPYFALHPPVYYGKRYARPYGASPFAAWPQLHRNPGYMPTPKPQSAIIFDNPHVGSAPCTTCTAEKTVIKPVEPLVIDNPFFEPTVQYTAAEETADTNAQTRQ